MVARRGASLLDLMAMPVGSQGLIPDSVASVLELLSVVDLESVTTPSQYVHTGRAQSIEEVALPGLRGWKTEIPGLSAGVPFRLVRPRTIPPISAPNTVEPATATAFVDLVVDPIAITVPGLRAAKLAGGEDGSAVASHLVPDPDRSAVRIWGSGVLRIGIGPTSLLFVDHADPFLPAAATGPVYRVGFDPPSFLIGDSGFGLVVDRLTFDDSALYSPPDVISRNQDAAWTGIAINEATVYFPRNAPLVGDVSAGVSNVLLGSPLGLQGELHVELGVTPFSPDAMEFVQYLSTGQQDLHQSSAGSRVVTLADGSSVGEVMARLPAANADWLLPDGTRRDNVADSGRFVAGSGDVLRVTPIEIVDDEQVMSPELAFTFVEFPPADAPRINAVLGSQTFTNVASVAGSAESLVGIEFRTDPPNADVEWRLDYGATAAGATGERFDPPLPAGAGSRWVTLTDSQGRIRRCELDILAGGAAVVGTEAGPFMGDGTPLGVRAIESSLDLRAFHRRGRFVRGAGLAVLDGGLDVPPGGLARVTVELGTVDDPDEVPPPVSAPAPVRHLQVEVGFNADTHTGWGSARLDGPFTIDALQAWATGFTGAEILVVGRCCDIGGDDQNRTLADLRADTAANWLAGSGLTVHARGEQDAFDPAGEAAQQQAVDDGLMTAEDAATLRLVLTDPASPFPEGVDVPPRPRYRRVDIYAVGGTPQADAPTEAVDAQTLDIGLRRALIPGQDAEPDPPTPREPTLPFRVRLTVGWDSPTVGELADAIPSLAEVVVEWTSRPVDVPGAGEVEPEGNPPGSEVFTVIGRWAHDPRTGQTEFTLALESNGDPNGLAHVDNDVLAVALGLGPAVIAVIDPADGGGNAVASVALIAALGLAAAFGKDGKTILYGVEYQLQLEAGGATHRIVADYSVEIGFDTTRGDIPLPVNIRTADGKPMRVNFKGVGIEYDAAAADPWDAFRLVFDDVSYEIEDPGQWTMDGFLGELLRVTATRAGSGSFWIEVDLEFLVDLGVVDITNATIRIALDDLGGVEVSLRGLRAEIDVPGALKGSGELSVDAGGTFRAGLEVEVVPIQTMASAALAIGGGGFLSLEIGVILPAGIPLGPTGLGVYGFIGSFVSNGTRDVDRANADVVGRELEWFRVDPEDKYRPEPGQWALGVGAVVGTMIDTGYSFNALGMLVVEFPDPTVVFAVNAFLLATPKLPAASAEGSSTAFEILGLVVIDPDAVIIGVSAQYRIPAVLELDMSIGAYFPLAADGDSYVRIGSDGQNGRSGDPITAQLLPGTLDVSAWSYFMVEEKQLHDLGGDPRFSFDGFAVGFGAGWEIDWKAGPIELYASAKVLVGLGTKPLALVGGVFVQGELSLVVTSIAAQGELVLTIVEETTFLEGEFCGSVSLLFFELEGCVGITIGNPLSDPIPKPAPPIGKVSLVDRRGFSVAQGEVSPDGTTTIIDDVVWPDVVPLIEFTHYVESALPAGSAFTPGATPATSTPWIGASRLKYAFRLTKVELRRKGYAPLVGPYDSAWWWSTSRPGVLGPGDVALTSHEGRWLALMSWDPRPWSRGLSPTNTDAPSEPSGVVERLCDPPLEPIRSWALGQDMLRLAIDRTELRSIGDGEPPLPVRFAATATEHFGAVALRDAVLDAATRGRGMVPGEVEGALALRSVEAIPDDVTAVYRLPYQHDAYGLYETAGLTAALGPALVDVQLVLLACRGERQLSTDDWVCVDFRGFGVEDEPGSQFTHRGLRFSKGRGDGELFFTDGFAPYGVPELALPPEGLEIEVPSAVDELLLEGFIQSGAEIDVVAADRTGAVLISRHYSFSSESPDRLWTADLRATGITRIIVSGFGEYGIVSICTPPPEKRPPRPPDPPTVRGLRPDGEPVEWDPTILATLDDGCAVIGYTGRRTDQTWTGFEIDPWTAGTVGVVGVCGVTWEAADAAATDAGRASAFVELLNQLGAEDLEREELLDGDRTYELVLGWEYQGWKAGDGAETPPPTSAGQWLTGDEHIVELTTAPDVAVSDLPIQVDYLDQTVFDARALLKYLIGTEPDGAGAAPYFRDDPILVHWSVDHIPILLLTYGRELVFKFRRTDPPPGSRRPGEDYLDMVPVRLDGRLARGHLAPADARFVSAVLEAPCIDGTPPLGGTTTHLIAPLEPRAHYDLMVVAAPTHQLESDSVLVSVANFQASRYRDEAELLDALGFAAGSANPILPHDVIAPSALPTETVLGDAALDATLVTLGLDPWPLPRRPRTVAIWIAEPTGFALAGLLLEADEPIERAGRLGVDVAVIASTLLTTVRRNDGGSRVMLAPASPISLTGDEHEIELQLTGTVTAIDGATTAGTTVGRRRLLDRPRMAYQEE